jgi:hypothetical protein
LLGRFVFGGRLDSRSFLQPTFEFAPTVHPRLSGLSILSLSDYCPWDALSLKVGLHFSRSDDAGGNERFESRQVIPKTNHLWEPKIYPFPQSIGKHPTPIHEISAKLSSHRFSGIIPSPMRATKGIPPDPSSLHHLQVHPSPNAPTTRLQKRKPRKKPVQSPWELHYRYLNKLVMPYHYTHRCHPSYRDLWQIHSRQLRNKYTRDPIRSRSQHARLAFIASQKKAIARDRHEQRRKLAIQRRARQRLYRLAYLRFKKERIELFSKLRRLRKAYRLGWTAFREWLAWKGIMRINKRRWNGKRRRRNTSVADEIGLEAEHKVVEMFRSPGKK